MVTLLPWTYSLRTGKSVPQSTVKQEASRMRLLKRKLDSRETRDSSLFSDLRWSFCLKKVKRQTQKTRSKKAVNQSPMELCAKAWTELTRPERVRRVPRTESRKVAKMSQTFQTFIMPRFSCIMTECRKAVPASQGMRLAFSTGSQPQ